MADVNWLKCLGDTYSDPSVAGVGGTRPAWDTERPAWFPQEFDWVIGCTYIGMPTHRAPVRNVLGGKAPFRRDVFEQVGGFISGIGRDRGKRRLVARKPSSASGSASGCPGRSCCSTSKRSSGIASVRTAAASATTVRAVAEGLSKAMVTREVGADDGLSSERRHASRTLPRGVAHGLADAVRGDLSGLTMPGRSWPAWAP